MSVTVIRPQEGPQTEFLACNADIAGYGGSAGGGKTYGLLLQALRHINDPNFKAVVFRRVSEHILLPGALWDTSMELYPLVNARPRTREKQWIFPSGAQVKFVSMQHESNKTKFQGSQIGLLMFDELTHFTETQVEYVLSRLRSASGSIRPYIRMTMNPDPNSWVKNFFGPWVNRDYPIQAKSGEVLWRRRIDGGNDVEWFTEPVEGCQSMTFIRSSIYDNKILLENNPGYLTMLENMPYAEREQLLNGSWDEVLDGDYFQTAWFKVVREAPETVLDIRYWDLAMSENPKPKDDLDYAVGVLMGKTASGDYVIKHVERVRGTPLLVENAIKKCAEVDGNSVPIYIEREGGSMAVGYMSKFKKEILVAYDVHEEIVQGKQKKQVRAKPLSSFTQLGRLFLVEGPWNKDFINELCGFPNAPHDDQVDAASGAFSVLSKGRREVISVTSTGQVRKTAALPSGKREIPPLYDPVAKVLESLDKLR